MPTNSGFNVFLFLIVIFTFNINPHFFLIDYGRVEWRKDNHFTYRGKIRVEDASVIAIEQNGYYFIISEATFTPNCHGNRGSFKGVKQRLKVIKAKTGETYTEAAVTGVESKTEVSSIFTSSLKTVQHFYEEDKIYIEVEEASSCFDNSTLIVFFVSF